MKPDKHRSVIVRQRQYAQRETLQVEREAANYTVTMDDREEEEELISLLILREDRRGGTLGWNTRTYGKRAVA